MLTIRTATVADARVVSAFGRRSFHDTFATQNTPQDMEQYLREHFSESVQAAELADSNTVTLVAEAEAQIVGYAQLRKTVPPPCVDGRDPIELIRFYVDRRWHGHGMAQSLMRAVDAHASPVAATVWLGVWEKNARAIAFYRKCGFVDVGSHVFMLGQDRQIDRIMARAVRSEASVPGRSA
jgi:GNAT superfamily N-acetyltransferase